MKRTIDVYTDGGVFPEDNLCKWAFIVVQSNKVILQRRGEFSCSGNHNADVEKAEATALMQAVQYTEVQKANYIIWTDSRAYLDKIQGKVGNKSGSSEFKYIQKVIRDMNSLPFPLSLEIKWKRRRSDKWMELVDDLAGKD